jgi:superfamily II DNA or RNA helicase
MQFSQSDSDETLQGGHDVRAGANVRLRGARWRVVEVRGYDACRLVTLTGLAPPHLGVVRRVLEPFDRIDPVERRREPRIVSARRWRRACRALIATDAPPASLIAARSARIDLLPHQLEPALAIVGGLGTRLLLGDEVGLGKTIEAALIVAELRARGSIERVLVLTPAGLRDQWEEELRERFALDATHVDAPALRQLAAALPIGVNPWSTTTLAIASIDYVKRAEVLPAVAACRWDVVIIDEAHGVAGDSDRHTAARTLSARAPYVLLLTATPHSGDPATFDALQRIGSTGEDAVVVFRRTRAQVRIQSHRHVHTLRVRPTPSERRMHAALACYGSAVRTERSAAWLALSVLHKRAFSSAWALLQSVERRLAALADTTAVDAEQLALPLVDASGELLTADEAPEWPAGLALADPIHERRLLTAVADACRTVGSRESKVAALARLLRRTNEPAIVFTEYRDTLLHVHRQLAGLPLVVLHGGLTREERAAALAAFSTDAPAVLLATDAAGEGLNLHRRCRLVINLELPWNPMRLEQRIGRVDRIGQQRTVHAVHLVARNTGEVRILDRLKARVLRAQTALGAPDPLGVDEIEMARHVVAGQCDSTGGPEAGALIRDVVMPDLGAVAIAEASRLRVARAFTRKSDETLLTGLESDGPWIIRASDRRRLRAAIGSKTLAIWRVELENAAGRMLASRLVAFTVEGAPRIRTHLQAKRVIREFADRLAYDAKACSQDWCNRAGAAIRAFTSVRLARERAIAGTLDRTRAAAFQAGLFDRRAERDHNARADALLQDQHAAADRITALESGASIECVRSELLLAVLP